MPFIDINNLPAIQALASGNFALPTMAGPPNLLPLLSDTVRLRSSIKAMKTIMGNRGLAQIAALIPDTHDEFLPQHLNALENSIIADMTAYLQNPHQALLEPIFHKIQLWGGVAGRHIYVKGRGFAANWNPAAYADFVQASTTSVHWHGPDPRIKQLSLVAERIKQFGVAFGTKHARFWAQAANVKPLLIYDRIMARGCLGKNATWNDYGHFNAKMADHALQANTNVATLERHAFNAFDTPAGAAWLAGRG